MADITNIMNPLDKPVRDALGELEIPLTNSEQSCIALGKLLEYVDKADRELKVMLLRVHDDLQQEIHDVRKAFEELHGVERAKRGIAAVEDMIKEGQNRQF